MFTQNQVRQLYVATDCKAAASGIENPGDIYVGSQMNDVYFNFVNVDGDKMRTDVIDKNKIMSVTFTPAEAMEYRSKATFVKLSSEDLDDGAPKAVGQDHILNIRINQLYWHSDEAYGWKYGAVYATASMTESGFYKTMAKSLLANLSRDPEQLLRIYTVNTSGAAADPSTIWNSASNYTEITKESDVPTGDVYGIVVDEAEQPWKLGTMKQDPVYYEAKSDNVLLSSEDVKWGVETIIPGNTKIQNGKKVADMEWFYHGERGDIYRDASWPNNWKDEMMADPKKKYDMVDIHYYWNGANHAVQKSEKDITIACPATTGAATGEVSYKLVQALKTAAGITDAGLTGSGTSVQTVIMG